MATVEQMWLSIAFLGALSIILLILQRPERRYTGLGSYYRKIRIELSAVKYRRDVFSQVVCGEIITIKLDPSKEYSRNAVGAYTESGKLLGYIPRHQRKLISTFRDNSESLATIYKKFHKGAHFTILIEVFLPTHSGHGLHHRAKLLHP